LNHHGKYGLLVKGAVFYEIGGEPESYQVKTQIPKSPSHVSSPRP
jgi:hypothetical protein